MSMCRPVMLLGASAVIAGCGSENFANATSEDPFSSEILSARDGALEGQIGARVLEQTAAPVRLFSGPTQLVISGAVERDSFAAMLQLTVDLDAGLLVPDTDEHVTFSSAPELRLLACVGQSIGVYDEYESVADDLVFTVDAADGGGPGDVVVTATGTWNRPHADPPSEARVATVRFVLER